LIELTFVGQTFIELIGFRCDDRAIGQFCVWVVDKDLEEIAYIEGKNEDGAEPITGFNLGKFSVPHLKAIFPMARCRREMEQDRVRLDCDTMESI
jgi:hypothetical protein